MQFKPKIWIPITVVLGVVNWLGAGWAIRAAEPMHAGVHVALGLAFGWWAMRLRQAPRPIERGGTSQELEAHGVAIEDAQSTLADQAAQIAELQERVDFAERLLAQARDRIEHK